MRPKPLACLLNIFFIIICASGVNAQMYKYKDAQGNWHFTDAPVDVPVEAEQVNSITDEHSRDLKEKLFKTISPQNKIETANIATVAVQTAAGGGSGFFVSSDGYIITNKHVVRGDEKQISQTKNRINKQQSNINKVKHRLEQRAAWLKRSREQLRKNKKIIDRQIDSPIRDKNLARYKKDLERFKRMEVDYHRQKKSVDKVSSQFSEAKRDFDARHAGLQSDRRFKITLADNSVYTVYLVKISQQHDLALLKLDGYQTPHLKIGDPKKVRQGDNVFAIGNPINFKNSVSSGILSGTRGAFLQTTAQIYPGNSGGPLVTEDGSVVGVNTMKMITHKYEGLGFAISIKIAMDEFQELIK